MIPVRPVRIYTAWGQDGIADTLIEGREQPKFSDGTFQNECPELIWVIEAKDWNEANRIYHKLQGWEPYVPMN